MVQYGGEKKYSSNLADLADLADLAALPVWNSF